MQLALKNGVTFCRLGSHLVFLDTGRDRYFGLRSPSTGGYSFSAIIEQLRANGLVEAVEDPADETGARWFQPFRCMPADRELRSLPTPAPLMVAAAFLLHRQSAKLLRRQHFSTVLKKLESPSAAEGGPQEPLVMHLRCAAAFRTSAPLFDQRRGCLTRSVALKSMLLQRGASARLILGVKMYPFSAHAWVQVGGTVLNDTLDVVQTYTPIASF